MKSNYRNRVSMRLPYWHYGRNAAYFVTICTKNRLHFFGEITDYQVIHSAIGQLAHDFWLSIPEHFPFIRLDAFVIMPNHVHGILVFEKSFEQEDFDCQVFMQPASIAQQRFQNQGKNTLSSVVGSYKSIVSRHARKLTPEFAWQSRFHEIIIPNENAFRRIAAYIKNNPRKWQIDQNKRNGK